MSEAAFYFIAFSLIFWIYDWGRSKLDKTMREWTKYNSNLILDLQKRVETLEKGGE